MVWATPAASQAQAQNPPSQSDNTSARNPHATAPMKGDDMLTSKVTQRLKEDRLLKEAEIFVQTSGGVVTLAGSVPSELAHSEAVEVTRAMPGVSHVEDQLRVLISSPDAPEPHSPLLRRDCVPAFRLLHFKASVRVCPRASEVRRPR